MEKLLLTILTLLVSTALFAQNEKSSPEALKILNKVYKKYAKYKSIDASFVMKIQGEGVSETMKAQIIQRKKRFYLKADDVEVISDGKNIWTYIKQSNEVEISNASDAADDESLITPDKLFKMYEEKDKFVCDLLGKATVNGKRVDQIIFKPKDRSVDYSKMYLSVSTKTKDIVQVKVFGKDGTTYTLNVNRVLNKRYKKSFFKFNKKKYPGVDIIDNRI